MATFAELRQDKTRFYTMIAVGAGVLIFWAAMALPRFQHASQMALAVPEMRLKEQVGMLQTLPVSPDAAVDNETTAAKGIIGGSVAVDRKIVRTTTISLVVQHPADSAEKLRTLAEQLGGYLESSQINGSSDSTASLTLRVPVSRFEEARAAIRKLGVRVENETLNSRDVTMQFVDQQATLRNLHAEEAQYLEILKRAAKVTDALEVSEKLSEVRGQIEQQQSEFNALSKQTELVAITLSLQTEPPPQTFGLNWRPMLQLKLAFHDGLEGVANYSTAMIGVLFYLPAVILWVGTILGSLLLGWKLLAWSRRRWFPTPVAEQKPA